MQQFDIDALADKLKCACREGDYLKAITTISTLKAKELESVALMAGFTIVHEQNKRLQAVKIQSDIAAACRLAVDGYGLRAHEKTGYA